MSGRRRPARVVIAVDGLRLGRRQIGSRRPAAAQPGGPTAKGPSGTLSDLGRRQSTSDRPASRIAMPRHEAEAEGNLRRIRRRQVSEGRDWRGPSGAPGHRPRCEGMAADRPLVGGVAAIARSADHRWPRRASNRGRSTPRSASRRRRRSRPARPSGPARSRTGRCATGQLLERGRACGRGPEAIATLTAGGRQFCDELQPFEQSGRQHRAQGPGPVAPVEWSAIDRAKARLSGGNNGPSARTRSTIGLGSAHGRDVGLREDDPERLPAPEFYEDGLARARDRGGPGGTRYVYVRGNRRHRPHRGATSTRRTGGLERHRTGFDETRPRVTNLAVIGEIRRAGWRRGTSSMISSMRCRGPLDLARLVGHDVVVVGPGGPARWRRCAGAVRARRRSRSRATSYRANRVSIEGGTTKIRRASATRSLTCCAPCTSILRITSCPAASACWTWARWRPVPVAVDLVRLQQPAVRRAGRGSPDDP